jgi:hypothetical protein
MFKYGIALVIIVLAAALLGCGSGDGGGSKTPEATAEGSPAVEPTVDGQGSPRADDAATPSAGETPDGEPTPEVTPLGTPVAAPSPGAGVDMVGGGLECTLDREESVAECGDKGSFAIDPPLSEGYTDCTLHLIFNQPAQLVCSGSESLPNAYYVIPPPMR